MRFADIIEQDQAKSHAQGALRTGRISHAYLFGGSEGMGKRMFARTYAQAILCENRQERDGQIEPCESCRACVMAQGEDLHPDLRILSHEKNNYSVEEIRDQLVRDIALKPMVGERRIYIIPEADRMNSACQNALLKTLEEPPAYAVIMLLSERPQALLQTILSRVVELDLRPVHDEAIIAYLMKKHRIPDYRARECAALAEGNMGLAIRYAGDDRFLDMVGRTAALFMDLERLTTGEIMDRLRQILFPQVPGEEEKPGAKKRGLKEAGERELNRFLDVALILTRDALIYKAGAPEKLVFAGQEAYDRKAALSPWPKLYQDMERIEEARKRLSANVSADMTMELLLLGIKMGARYR